MELLDNIVSIFESIIALLILGSIIWVATSEFKLKGFVISTGSIILAIIALVWYEKFLNYSLDNNPLLIIIMLGLMALFLVGVVVYAMKKEYDTFKYSAEAKRQFKNNIIISLKQLVFSLLFGFAIVGIIFLFVWCSNT